MPSPVGHGLVGLLCRPLLGPSETSRTRAVLLGGALVCAASLPDFDFIPGFLLGTPDRFHHLASHSLLAALAFGLVVGLAARALGAAVPVRWGLTFGLAYLSHLVLDLVTVNTPPSEGLPFWWPVSSAEVTLPWSIFLDIQREDSSRRFLSSLLSTHNAMAIGRELVILVPVWLASRFIARRRRSPRTLW